MQQMKLGLSMRGLGYHPSAWRDPDVQPDGGMDVRHSIRVARAAERGLFDFIFLADHAAVVVHDLPKGVFGRHQGDTAELEPLTLLAALSVVTTKIGLVATASTTLHEPYQLAPHSLSIDHVRGIRAGRSAVSS